METADEVDKPPNSYRITYFDILVLTGSIIFYLLDVVFDICLLVNYYTKENYVYFWWTLVFTVVPSVIITFISVSMYVNDLENGIRRKYAIKRIIFCVFGMLLQVALLIRYIDSFQFAIKSIKAKKQGNRKKQEENFNRRLHEDADVALLRVFECYLESSLQQVLQITLLLIEHSYGSDIHKVWQFIFITFSFVGMGVCMASYNKCIRFDSSKENLSHCGSFAQFFWHLHITVSRILVLAALAFINPLWACLAILGHWLAMSIWIHVTFRNNFCGNKTFYDILFSCATGLIYIFNYIGLVEGPTKKYYAFFYGLCFVENVIISGIWATFSVLPHNNWVYYFFMIFPVLSFLIGIVFLGIYYLYLHPTKSKSNTLK